MNCNGLQRVCCGRKLKFGRKYLIRVRWDKRGAGYFSQIPVVVCSSRTGKARPGNRITPTCGDNLLFIPAVDLLSPFPLLLMSAPSLQCSCSSPSRPAPFGLIESVGNHPIDRGTSRIPARLVNLDSGADDSCSGRLPTPVSSHLALVSQRPTSTLEFIRPEMDPLDLLTLASLPPYLSAVHWLKKSFPTGVRLLTDWL